MKLVYVYIILLSFIASEEKHRCNLIESVRVDRPDMDMSFLSWVLAAFLVGLAIGGVLGNHWAKVAFYWTQNKIRHLRDHH